MRARLDTTSVDVQVGVPFALRVEVQNDTAQIRSVSARIPLLPNSAYTVRPLSVSVFPNELTELEIEITLPHDTPAGEEAMAIEVVDDTDAVVRLECVIDVAARDELGLSLSPKVITGGAKATIIATVSNWGNRPTGVSINAADADKKLRYVIEPRNAQLQGGQSQAFKVMAKGRRPLLGGSVAHAITVVAESRAQKEVAAATFTSKPRLSRGLLTIFMLAGILALWVMVFSAGFRAALSGQQTLKSAPAADFFHLGVKPNPTVSIGLLKGRVFADSDSRPLARMVVTAFPQGTSRAPTAASTDQDGAFTIAGLAPGIYQVTVSGAGFATTPLDSDFRVRPASEIELDDVFVVGTPAVIGGGVAAAGSIPAVTVESRIMVGDTPGSFAVTTQGDDVGSYSLEGLASPGRYRLTFTAPGFDPVQLFQEVSPGETVTLPTVQMLSGPGVITGLVVDQEGTPLGGVELTATAGTNSLTTVTPTAGTAIGQFVLGELPSPATYLVQVALEGYGTQTLTVRVEAGASVALSDPVVLQRGTGVVRGRVISGSGAPLGGVSVVASSGIPLGQTLTVDADGSYVLRGLPVPGAYTLTFTLAGFRSETIAVSLTPAAGELTVNVPLVSLQSAAVGQVRGPDGTFLGSVPIVATSGTTVLSTLSTDPEGRFRLEGLSPGFWTFNLGEPGSPAAVLLVELVSGDNDLGVISLRG
jgi:hypothetical protein